MIRHLFAVLLAALAFNAFAAVDANQATRAELESIKGIGPSLSDKIVQARQTSSFKNWNDLVERVGGIGPGNAARLSQAGLTVGGAAWDASAAPARADKSPKAERGDSAARKTRATEQTPATPAPARTPAKI